MPIKRIINLYHIFISLNFNVKLVFAFSFFQSFGRGIWMGNVLSSYIFLIANESNVLLGLTSAITGLAMTITVIPAGFLTDRFSRSSMLKTAAIFGFIGLGFAIQADTIEIIFVALLFWGLFQGFNRPALETIFADSVESGNRSKVYSWVHLTRQFAMAAGPFTNVILFWFIGDVWEIEVLKTVMIVGILFSMLSLLVMLFFNDKKGLSELSESLAPIISDNNDNNTNRFTNRPQIFVAIILMSSNLIIGTGAGMTIKFFPIFFMQIYLLAPIAVQLIMGFTSIFTGLASLMAQRFSLNHGRAKMIFIVQGVATLCLFVIAFYPPLLLLIPIFIIRGSLMNASQPLSRSILMDVVPKKHRGKVNSFQALSWGLFWNISAAMGGFLIGDNNNYQLCFLITASVYVIGTALILLIIPFVVKEKKKEKSTSEI